jgi:DNA modification methylase
MLGQLAPNQVHHMDCLVGLRQMPENCIDIAITRPPYWGQRGDTGIGLEEDPSEYVNNQTSIFLEVMRVHKLTGLFG